MTDHNDLIERLEELKANGLRSISMGGSDAVGVGEVAQAIRKLVEERDQARTLVSSANNSLFGSLGYFHSINGGAFDTLHLARPIEDLKSSARKAALLDEAVGMLTSQGDNMAFLLNHADVPGQWYSKFEGDLAEARAFLSKVKDQKD